MFADMAILIKKGASLVSIHMVQQLQTYSACVIYP